MEQKPAHHIFNVGNKEAISIREWVELCCRIAGRKVEFENVYEDIEQRNYFCFYDYEYMLDVSKQHELMKDTISMNVGLNDAFNWYTKNKDKVNKKPYFDYIDKNFQRQ